MGMGDSGRNPEAVGEAVDVLADSNRMRMSPGKLTISTVGPSPEIFGRIAKMPGTMAWSLHSPNDEIRRKLVPSTRHTVVELRDGLIKALQERDFLKVRPVKIAVTLIDGVNDRLQDAHDLADFLQPLLKVHKVAVEIIPYNDINVPGFSRPPQTSVKVFFDTLRQRGVYCTCRSTRGDDEYAACGMLATKRSKNSKSDETAAMV
jgi:23S rRNA (adenine2503-C2)-methyltransferase